MSLTHSARRLNRLIEAFDCTSYLEIGVEYGKTFFDISCSDKTAVDPHFRFDFAAEEKDGQRFYQQTSDLFFQTSSKSKYDLVFLDGLHLFENTLRDLLNSIACTHDQSFILIDDVLPTDIFSSLRSHSSANKFRQMHGLTGSAWHGDVFKVVFFIHDFLPLLEYATFDDGHNRQTLIWRKRRQHFQPVFNNLESISRLDYFDLYENFEILRCMCEEDIFTRLRADLPPH